MPMDRRIPPVVQIVGFSNTGKTTLLTCLLSRLSEEEWKVGSIKRHAGNLEMDEPGKDSWLHRQAGADLVAITAANQTALIFPRPLCLDELLIHYQEQDLVLVEGFKYASHPKLVMATEQSHLSLAQELSHVHGVVTPVPMEGAGVQQFRRDDVEGVAMAVKQLAGLKK